VLEVVAVVSCNHSSDQKETDRDLVTTLLESKEQKFGPGEVQSSISAGTITDRTVDERAKSMVTTRVELATLAYHSRTISTTL
jgi:hypothetical protein